MVKSLTASLVSREEEERHQKNLNENEQLKKQIAEVSVEHKLWYNFNKAIPVFSCAFPSKVVRRYSEILYFTFLHHRAKEAIHLTAFVRVQVSMQG